MRVLPAVVLHSAKALLPIDISADHRSGCQRLVSHMSDFAAFFKDVENSSLSETACVGGLAAALGKESSFQERQTSRLFTCSQAKTRASRLSCGCLIV